VEIQIGLANKIGDYVLIIDGTRFGTKSGYGYTILKKFDISEGEFHPELLKDYKRAIKKLDDCRACIARAVKKLGGNPTPPDKHRGSWHKWLINKLDLLIIDGQK
jgi:hypothetical protein